ncbi:hypothetical protein QUF50_04295 [Thiotrichales bacterium HSG1]|nr:hypothetical protein [Thiotrichales bacterium HSG1]
MVKVTILHEGNAKKTNDNLLLKLLIENLKLDVNRVEFFGMGSKSNFFKLENDTYNSIKMGINDEIISKILFVIDADYEKNDRIYGGYENTENGLKNIIDKLKFTDYSDVYITCDPKTKDGYLESLILSTIPEEHKNCIEDFLECSEFKSKDNHKSILYHIYNIAYPQKPYDFSHENFDLLKQKLKNLFNE